MLPSTALQLKTEMAQAISGPEPLLIPVRGPRRWVYIAGVVGGMSLDNVIISLLFLILVLIGAVVPLLTAVLGLSALHQNIRKGARALEPGVLRRASLNRS